MEKRLFRLAKGEDAVITHIKKAPRLQALGLTPGAVVYCKYKSNCVMVLEVEKRLIAIPVCHLRRVWADF